MAEAAEIIESHADQIAGLAERLDEVERYLVIDTKRVQRDEIQARASEPGFWDDPASAQAAMAEVARLGDDIKAVEHARELLEEAAASDELALEASDPETSEYAVQVIGELKALLDELELTSWFTGKFDHGDAIVTIKPGQGGLEAQDWTQMLFRMYLRYCERRKWKVTVNDAPAGDVLGLDRATFTVSGKDAFGMLRAEAGVHRLVRISPTDLKARRQTTFAGVEVLPILPDDIEVQINTEDLRVDVYHASGPGGQGVNTTDSAVRVTHLPTGIVVTCQNERSQLLNKATCMQILRSRLYEMELEKRADELEKIRGPKCAIGFGNQIRSYVLYPYQMVKDLRTEHETSNVEKVLEDGDLDPFIIAYHRWSVMQSQSEAE